MANKQSNLTKAQNAEIVKSDSKAKIQAAKMSIEESKKRIAKAKSDIASAKNSIKSQKAAIKAAKAASKNAKVEAKAESAVQKSQDKAVKAAEKADKAAANTDDDTKANQASQAVVGTNSDCDAVKRLGKFVVKNAADDSHMFNLFDENGQIIATSQTYSTLDSCQNGIKSVGINAPEAPIEDQTVKGYTELPNPKFEMYIDKSGSAYRFRLKAKNGKNIVASSQSFPDKNACIDVIKSIKVHAKAKIVDEG